MIDATVPRTRTPVVLVAYGEDGGRWLRALKLRFQQFPTVRKLIDRSVIQFWLIGEAADKNDAFDSWTSVPTLPQVADALNEARSASVQAEFPGLSVREVLVLERVSLFSKAASRHRLALRDVLHAVPDHQSSSAAGQQGFRYRWIALADSIHEPTRTSAAERRSAHDAAVAGVDGALTFLVDRQDSSVAIVDSLLADGCLRELAVSFVAGDLGAKRDDGVPVDLPVILNDASHGDVIPFGVAVLEHPGRAIESARVRDLMRRMAAGVPEHGAIERAFGAGGGLLEALKADIAALDRNRFDRHTRRRAREDALRNALGLVFAEGDVRWMRGYLVDVERTIPRLAATTLLTAEVGATMAGLASSPSTILRQGGLDATGGWFGLPVPIVASVALTLCALAGYAIYRRRSIAPPPRDLRIASDDNQTTQIMRDDVIKEWKDACHRLSVLLDAWEVECRNARTLGGGNDNTPIWRSVPPFSWRLTHELQLTSDVAPISLELCRDVAVNCLNMLDGRTPPEEVIENASRQELRRWDGRQIGGAVMTEYLRAALSAPNTSDLKRFVRSRPYLVNPTLPPERDAVVWLTAPGLRIGATIQDLESAAASTSTVVLSHDDDERSIRLSFARPIPWDTIPSLHVQ